MWHLLGNSVLHWSFWFYRKLLCLLVPAELDITRPKWLEEKSHTELEMIVLTLGMQSGKVIKKGFKEEWREDNGLESCTVDEFLD